jgi:RND family efflux transporter MFP subunit
MFGDLMKYIFSLLLTIPLLASVVTQPVTKGSLNIEQNFNGNISFNQKSRLAAESSGLIKEVLFDETDEVKKGTVLLKIDSEILDAKIKAIEASIKEVSYSLEKAKLDFKRYEVLLKKQSVSKQKYDEFYFNKLGLEQKLISLESTLRASEIEKDKKSLRAPFSGFISKRNVEVGEWLSAGKQVALLINPSKIDITVHLPSSFIKTIRKDKIIFVNINNKKYKAKVLGVLLQGNEKTRTFPFKLRLLETKDRFFDGMQVSLKLEKSTTKDVLLVSRDAVINRFGKDIVFIKKDNKAKMIKVKVLGFQKDKVAVYSENLHVEDEVIIKGNERIFPNQELK